MWSTVKPFIISWIIDEAPYCVLPAATVAYTYNHFYEQNKIKAFSIGFAGYIVSAGKLSAMEFNQQDGVCSSETSDIILASVTTSIACSSTVAILLTALNKLNIDNNGVVVSAFTIAGSFTGVIMNMYKNEWSKITKKPLIHLDEYYMFCWILGSIFGTFVVYLYNKFEKDEEDERDKIKRR